MKATPSNSLFPVELPALTFDSRSLSLIDSSAASTQLFKRKLEVLQVITAADLLLPQTTPGYGATEAEVDQLRDRLTHLSRQSEQLAWGDSILMEYYTGFGQDATPEKADVLVSSRQAEGLETFTILFLRPRELQAPPLFSSSSTPQSPSSTGTSHSFIDQLLPATENGGGGGGSVEGEANSTSKSTPSVRSASFSSTDKRPRPTTGKEREKLPLSAETTYLLNRATAQVSADNAPNSTRSANTSRRSVPPLSLSSPSPSSFKLNRTSTSTLSASSLPSGPEPAEKEKAVEGMHTIFKNSPVYHPPTETAGAESPPESPPTDERENGESEETSKVEEPDNTEDAGDANPSAESASRLPLDTNRMADLMETEPLVSSVFDVEVRDELRLIDLHNAAGFVFDGRRGTSPVAQRCVVPLYRTRQQISFKFHGMDQCFPSR